MANQQQDEEQMYHDLVGFLLSDRTDLRIASTDAVLSQVMNLSCTDDGSSSSSTTTSCGNRFVEKLIFQHNLVSLLAKNVSYPDIRVSVNALKALTILTSSGSTSSQCTLDLASDDDNIGGLNRMIEIVLSTMMNKEAAAAKTARDDNVDEDDDDDDDEGEEHKNSSNNNTDNVDGLLLQQQLQRQQVNLAMSLLANMTRTEAGAIQVAGQMMPDEAIPTLSSSSQEQEEAGKQQITTKTTRQPKPTMELMLSRFMDHEKYVEKGHDANEYDTLLLEQQQQQQEQQEYGVQQQGGGSTTTTTGGGGGARGASSSSSDLLDSNTWDPYQHFAAVLMNVTQVEAGRRFVMRITHQHQNDNNNNNDREIENNTNSSSSSSSSSNITSISVLQRVLSELRSPNPIRRRGIAGMIRNCCLDVNSAWWFLNIVNITKHILYPLAGPEELDPDEKYGLDPDLWLLGPDKVREIDYYTRLYLIESILLLCSSGRKSREHLRLKRCYVILKWTDMVEIYEDISERINECVQFLRRDEHGTKEGSSDQFVYDTYHHHNHHQHQQKSSSISKTACCCDSDKADAVNRNNSDIDIANSNINTLSSSSEKLKEKEEDFDDVD